METFWQAFAKWDALGQFLFIVLILGGLTSFILTLFYIPINAITTIIRGHAPEAPVTNHYLTKNYYMDGKKLEEAEEDEEEEE